jgi:hypothetical protein
MISLVRAILTRQKLDSEAMKEVFAAMRQPGVFYRRRAKYLEHAHIDSVLIGHYLNIRQIIRHFT